MERGGSKHTRERMRKLLWAGTGRELMEPEEQEEQQRENQYTFLLHEGYCYVSSSESHIPINDS